MNHRCGAPFSAVSVHDKVSLSLSICSCLHLLSPPPLPPLSFSPPHSLSHSFFFICLIAFRSSRFEKEKCSHFQKSAQELKLLSNVFGILLTSVIKQIRWNFLTKTSKTLYWYGGMSEICFKFRCLNFLSLQPTEHIEGRGIFRVCFSNGSSDFAQELVEILSVSGVFKCSSFAEKSVDEIYI